jgi:hypothetical protein
LEVKVVEVRLCQTSKGTFLGRFSRRKVAYLKHLTLRGCMYRPPATSIQYCENAIELYCL